MQFYFLAVSPRNGGQGSKEEAEEQKAGSMGEEFSPLPPASRLCAFLSSPSSLGNSKSPEQLSIMFPT
ncbi:MAG: hypothetical protein V7L20_12125 [Nostoc sp.]